MTAVCVALAYATEPSDATFSARAALIGAATLALMSDMAARSGSASPASSSSSSRVRILNSCSLMTFLTFVSSYVLRGLTDVARLCGVRVRGRVVRQDVQRGGEIDRDRHVGVHERHRRALRKRLTGKILELFPRESHVPLCHCAPLPSRVFRVDVATTRWRLLAVVVAPRRRTFEAMTAFTSAATCTPSLSYRMRLRITLLVISDLSSNVVRSRTVRIPGPRTTETGVAVPVPSAENVYYADS